MASVERAHGGDKRDHCSSFTEFCNPGTEQIEVTDGLHA
jgi:hypothetical protein